MDNLNSAIDDYVTEINRLILENVQTHYPTLFQLGRYDIASAMKGGTRYTRIILTNGGDRSVHSFVDNANGDILKANGWKVPHPKPRGNVFRLADGGFNHHGANYLK